MCFSMSHSCVILMLDAGIQGSAKNQLVEENQPVHQYVCFLSILEINSGLQHVDCTVQDRVEGQYILYVDIL